MHCVVCTQSTSRYCNEYNVARTVKRITTNKWCTKAIATNLFNLHGQKPGKKKNIYGFWDIECLIAMTKLSKNLNSASALSKKPITKLYRLWFFVNVLSSFATYYGRIVIFQLRISCATFIPSRWNCSKICRTV